MDQAQALIHESLHLTGITDECIASKLERRAMALAGFKPFDNAYVRRCGLEAEKIFSGF